MCQDCIEVEVEIVPDERMNATVTAKLDSYPAAVAWVAEKVASLGSRGPDSLNTFISDETEEDGEPVFSASVQMHALNWRNPPILTEMAVAVSFQANGEARISVGSGAEMPSSVPQEYFEEALGADASTVFRLQLVDGYVAAEPEVLMVRRRQQRKPGQYLMPVVNGVPYPMLHLSDPDRARIAAAATFSQHSAAGETKVYLVSETDDVPHVQLLISG